MFFVHALDDDVLVVFGHALVLYEILYVFIMIVHLQQLLQKLLLQLRKVIIDFFRLVYITGKGLLLRQLVFDLGHLLGSLGLNVVSLHELKELAGNFFEHFFG